MRRALSLLVGLALLALVGACGDKELAREVDAQGNEVAGVPRGPLHRAGQRCAACHRDGGEAGAHPFSLAGTVFAQPARQVGVADVEILLSDSDGSKFVARTNCVGNFFVRPEEWQPHYPVIVDVQKNGVRREMSSVIGRADDCATCHKVAVTDPFADVGHVYLFGTDEPGLPDGDPSCPVDPVRPGTQ